MARVEITQSVGDRTAFAKRVQDDIAADIRKTLDGVAAEVVAETNKIISQEFVNDRDPSRRKKNSRHLLDSIVCDVQGNDFPFTLVNHSLAPIKKVAALEQGARAHDIAAREPYDPETKKGGFVYFPNTRSGSGSAAYGKRGRIMGGGRTVKAESVFWYSTGKGAEGVGYRFLERGLKRVLDRRLGIRR